MDVLQIIIRASWAQSIVNILFSEEFTPTDALLDPRVDWTIGRRGIPFPVADLPASVTDYITANYVNPEIKRAKTNITGNFFVLVKTDDGRLVIKFDADGNYLGEILLTHHLCHGIVPVQVADLPTTITDYIADNYADGDIVRAGQRINSGKYIVVLNVNGERKIVVFDADGNFLFERD